MTGWILNVQNGNDWGWNGQEFTIFKSGIPTST
jgi:hypothetical protein